MQEGVAERGGATRVYPEDQRVTGKPATADRIGIGVAGRRREKTTTQKKVGGVGKIALKTR